LGGKCFVAATYILIEEKRYGTEIFTKRFKGCRARYEETQQGHAEKRPQRQEGYKPQAGNRAIGLSEARAKGKTVPRRKKKQ